MHRNEIYVKFCISLNVNKDILKNAIFGHFGVIFPLKRSLFGITNHNSVPTGQC